MYVVFVVVVSFLCILDVSICVYAIRRHIDVDHKNHNKEIFCLNILRFSHFVSFELCNYFENNIILIVVECKTQRVV